MEGLELTPEEEEGDAQVMALGDLRTKEGEGEGGVGGWGGVRIADDRCSEVYYNA